jgi:quercetin dioxygenase-like cupin family protein
MRVQRWQEASSPQEAVLRAALEAEGYCVYVWTDAPGTTYPPHAHGDERSHWVLRGAMVMIVGGEEFVLGPGDRDWMPAATVHSGHVVGEEAVTYLVGLKRRA